jgi:hypothetical protein
MNETLREHHYQVLFILPFYTHIILCWWSILLFGVFLSYCLWFCALVQLQNYTTSICVCVATVYCQLSYWLKLVLPQWVLGIHARLDHRYASKQQEMVVLVNAILCLASTFVNIYDWWYVYYSNFKEMPLPNKFIFVILPFIIFT